MNFLAHLFLSGTNEQVMIGNFIADSIRHKEIKNQPVDVQKGIQLHQRIDSFTDTHPKVKECTKLLHAAHGKYAPVLIDIFYDYFLIKNWSRYTDLDFEEFIQNAYHILEQNMEFVPPKLARYLPRMIDDNFLARYGYLDGIAFTVGKVQNRVSKPKLLDNPIESIFDHEQSLDINFNLFFPELKEAARLKRIELGIVDWWGLDWLGISRKERNKLYKTLRINRIEK